MFVPSDVFTVEEIARAAGVPPDAVRALIATGTIRPVAGTSYFTAEEAVRAGKQARRELRSLAVSAPGRAQGIFATVDAPTGLARRGGLPAFASSFVHATFVVTMLWLTSGSTQSAPIAAAETRLVFLARPGPGGGGGGGGLKNPLPPRAVETRGPRRSSRPVPAVSPERTPVSARRVEVAPPVPKPTPTPAPVVPDPLPSRVLIAPVAAAASTRQRDGLVQRARENTDSLGAGTAGGTGSGRGTGSGEGVGAGIGPGSGGGTGGGPYRAGSGIEPPRLIREIKAQYTEEARRRGIIGAVVLEIVINTDGAVGTVSVRRGLGAGLDERAVEAVRQWRFSPARRQGVPVDVIVEVAVEFAQR